MYVMGFMVDTLYQNDRQCSLSEQWYNYLLEYY